VDYVAPTTWDGVPAAVRTALADPFVKRSDGTPEFGPDGVPVLKHLADVLGWRAGDMNAFWGGPRPVSNLIIGAGLGSLGGYGLGRLAETVLPPKYFEPGAMRRRGALAGAVMGSLPAVWQGFDNVRLSGDPTAVLSRWPQETTEKVAVDLFAPVIDRDAFNRQVMEFDQTPMPIRAATAGLVEAASAVGGSSLVTPWDVAKVAVGAGSGLVSGVVAGKALGFLAGLTPVGQEGVQKLGLWSGILSAVVPRALGLTR
jgi:hypothetical protein